MSLQRQLTNQGDLVYQLDPEPVFDYLLQHRALDQFAVDLIKDEEKLSDRNIKLLQHLESLGNPAIELFINALRQSGQMHLASTLDVEHRIKPVYGQGYWEKQRYKGQVTISFQMVAAKVLVRKDSEEDKSPRIVDINAMLTPFKVKHSYENMTLLEDNDLKPRARKILEYSYEEEPEEKGCCWCCLWCFCCCSSSAKKKKEKQKQQAVEVSISKQPTAELDRTRSGSACSLYDVMVSLPSQPSSPIKSGSTFFKTRKLSPTVDVAEFDSPGYKLDPVDRNSNHQLSELIPNTPLEEHLKDLGGDKDVTNEEIKASKKADKAQKTKQKQKNSKKKGNNEEGMVEVNNQKNGNVLTENVDGNCDKENTDPSIWDVKENGVDRSPPEKSKTNTKVPPPKSLRTTGMKRSETYELVERWKSEGRVYQAARDQFFTFFDQNMQSRIVRYFEQERSTLVLQVGVKEGMTVCTICMTTRQVKTLREDYEMGSLHEDLVRCVSPQEIIDSMECCAIHLRTVIDVEDFALSFQELA